MILVGFLIACGHLQLLFYNFIIQGSPKLKNIHQTKEDSIRVSGHTHHHFKDSVADHVHQSEDEENLMARRLSGKFSGIEKIKKYKLLKPKSTGGEEKAYIFNLF